MKAKLLAVIMAALSTSALGESDMSKESPKTLGTKLLSTTIRIEAATPQGSSIGTGFFYSIRLDDKTTVPLLVTCKHVVAGATNATLRFSMLNEDGSRHAGATYNVSVADFEKKCIPHPNASVDLCAFPLLPVLTKAKQEGKSLEYTWVGQDNIATGEFLHLLGALRQVVFVGYPIGFWDAANNSPVARQGVTASDPVLDFNGKPAFLIDAACYPGSSGSPVFYYAQGVDTVRKTLGGESLIFLGVLHAGPMYTAEGKLVVKNIPTAAEPRALTQVPMNLGIVIKAAELTAFENLFRAGMKDSGTGPTR